MRVSGKRSEIAAFELLDADSEHAREGKRATAVDFERGLRAFREGAYAVACVHFEGVLGRHAGDAAARMYLRMAAQAILGRIAEVGS
jgi:hypothetical protein